jgi:hypothetical protein
MNTIYPVYTVKEISDYANNFLHSEVYPNSLIDNIKENIQQLEILLAQHDERKIRNNNLKEQNLKKSIMTFKHLKREIKKHLMSFNKNNYNGYFTDELLALIENIKYTKYNDDNIIANYQIQIFSIIRLIRILMKMKKIIRSKLNVEPKSKETEEYEEPEETATLDYEKIDEDYEKIEEEYQEMEEEHEGIEENEEMDKNEEIEVNVEKDSHEEVVINADISLESLFPNEESEDKVDIVKEVIVLDDDSDY